MWIYLLAVVAYLTALAVLSWWSARRGTGHGSGDDFLVAGRSLPAHVLILTLLSTWIGAGSLFGGAGLGYRAGVPALWQSAGAWVGILLIFFIAPRVRRIARYGVPDILERRYGPAARVLGAVTIVFAYTGIAAYQFRGGGRLLNLVAGVDPQTGAIVAAAFCVLCTAFAGMRSIARLDVVNALTMIGGVGIAIVYLIGRAGGVAPALSSLRPDQLTLFGAMSPWQALALFLPTLCLLLGEASMYQKFFSARDERAARIAVAGWLVATVAVESMIVWIGLLGSVTVPGLGTAESETIVIRIAVGVLPTLIGMLLLAAAAAIIVSTANSTLLTAATNLVRDVYQRFVNTRATDRQLVLATRLAIAGLAAGGVFAGGLFPTTLSIALWAYTMYGAAITPALVAALAWPRATREAGVYSIAAGMAVTLLWELSGLIRGTAQAPGYLFGLQPIYPALAISVSILIATTYAPKARDSG